MLLLKRLLLLQLRRFFWLWHGLLLLLVVDPRADRNIELPEFEDFAGTG